MASETGGFEGGSRAEPHAAQDGRRPQRDAYYWYILHDQTGATISNTNGTNSQQPSHASLPRNCSSVMAISLREQLPPIYSDRTAARLLF